MSDNSDCYCRTMKTTMTFEQAIAKYTAHMLGRNQSEHTIRAYSTDLLQFVIYLRENDTTVISPTNVTKSHISEYMSYLSQCDLSGVTRARKLSAVRAFFRYLTNHEYVEKNPVIGIDTPKQEQRTRTSLRTDEYSRILAVAGSSPRDFAIFQVFLQTGIRVGELCSLTVADIDLTAGVLTVRDGKGLVSRQIELEKKAIKALKTYLAARGEPPYDALFLNRYGQPIGERGIRKLVKRFSEAAGLEKKVSPHIFRHTYASKKAERNINVFQLQAWLGHKDPKTTMRYVHLSRDAAKKLQEATSL